LQLRKDFIWIRGVSPASRQKKAISACRPLLVPTIPLSLLFFSKLYWLKGMYKESQERYERTLDLQHDTQAKAAAHKAWIAGGEPAVERWDAKNIKALARKQYFET
jgi:hypothetical protein